ncbi:putative DLP12 prophage integrase [Escherichia coli DEC1B]|nr:putative DLP12 prophage integrase [Escherichia coli DEC1B]
MDHFSSVVDMNPEDSKSNRAIGVALNDTASKVLHDQTGKHHKCGCTYQGG